MSNVDKLTYDVQESLEYLCALESGDREAAIDALAAIGEPALPSLLRVMKHSNACLPAEQVNYMHHSEVIHLVETIQQSVDETLVRIGQPAVEPLIELIQTKETSIHLQERAGRLLHRIGEPAVQPLTALLKHDNPEVRAVAASALADTTDEQAMEALRETLYDAVKTMQSHRQRTRKVTAIMVAGYCLLIVVSIILFRNRFQFYFIQIPLQTLGVLAGVDAQVKLRRNAVTALGKSASPQMLGAFAACLEDRDADVRQAAQEALIELLPRVQASDRAYLSSADMDILLKRLGGKDRRLTLAILKALEQIGDEKALTKVEAIASDRFNPDDILLAAQACLPFLRERSEALRQAHTLLRASEPTTAPETLLRPVQGSAPVEANQLLRPKL